MRFEKKKTLHSKELLKLYESVNWASPKDKKDKGKYLQKIYKNSQIIISAWEGKELIGAIRALTDKELNGVIFGLIVKPKHQRKGIGKEIIRRCVNQYPNIRWYVASANSSLNKFYIRAGFKKDQHHWFCLKK
ncbi:MAG: GNAT family N-acetyltransferase [Candidatus Nanoarchaeia archaeon]